MATLKQAAPWLRVMGDVRRLRLLRLLLTHKELCVCELVDALQLPQYEVSRHLAALRKAGWVNDRRRGLWAYYSIAPSVQQDWFAMGLLELVKERLSDPKQAADDVLRLEQRLGLRVAGQCVVGFQE